MSNCFVVALLSPPYASLTYRVPAWLPPQVWHSGQLALVPLGRGSRLGLLLEPCAEPDGFELKDLLWPLSDQALLNAEYLQLIRELAARQAVSPGRILSRVLPQALRESGRVRLRVFTGQKPYLYKLTDLARLGSAELHELGQARQEGRLETIQQSRDLSESEICRLNCDPPWPVRPNALRQRELLDHLLAHGQQSRMRLKQDLPAAYPALDGLLKARLVSIARLEAETEQQEENPIWVPPPPPLYTLTDQQTAVVNDLIKDLESGQSQTKLLYGVTGSGKTAVYLELAGQCLARGKSALLLAPEVALALKLHRECRERFPQAKISLYHGYQHPLRRARLFGDLAANPEPCLIIGTRSALFLPLPATGLIVLDEEHDASFKQDDAFNYQAKEVAWQRARAHQALLLLASATPDLKTFHSASQGHIPMLRMPKRLGAASLPGIELVRIKDKQLLSPTSLDMLRETLTSGEQAVILLNRRGYAPLLYCLDCGQVARCPNCEIGLTYHKKREQLVCHYCGHSRAFPTPCAKCGGLHFLPMGEGTERLEERLLTEELAPLLGSGGRVLRLDRDSTSREGKMEEILTAFANRESQILVGTQMLSKGHHFPDVTLVVVADADLGLHLPDYRSAERTFQLMLQSAGRAGRGSKPGRVLIQTRDVNHYCWKYVRESDYEGFYAEEISLREKRQYPPFVKLALIRFSFPPGSPDALAKIREFSAALRRQSNEILVLGPAPSPLSRLNNRMRYQCLVKADNWPVIRQAYTGALRQTKLNSGPNSGPKSGPKSGPNSGLDLRLSLDLDPLNML